MSHFIMLNFKLNYYMTTMIAFFILVLNI